MLKQLVKIKLLGLLGSMATKSSGANAKKKKASKGKFVLLAILYIYVLVVFGFLFGMMFSQLTVFNDIGAGWVYFALYAIISFVLMIIGSAAIAKAQLFDAKDNDLLLSMPIPPSYIIISRVLSLVVMNFAYFLSVLIPAVLMWAIYVGFSVMGVIAFILLSLGLLLLSTAMGVLMGWVIALLSRRAKSKTLISIIFTLGFLAVYFYFYTSAQKYLELIVQNGAEIAGKLKAVLPLYWFGAAISDGNIVYILLALLVCVAPFAIVFWVLSKTFNRIISDSRATVRIKEKKARFDAVSPKRALLRRETSHVFASAPYLLNSGLGVIMGILAAVFLIVKGDMISTALESVEMARNIMASLLICAAIFLIGMVYFTSAAISIEGKTLWVLRSLPISSKDIIVSKLRFHLIATAPVSIMMWIAINVVCYVNWAFVIYSFLILAVYTLLTANIGMIENLRHPILDWTDEAVAVKSGMSVMFTMLINMVLTFLPLVLILVLSAINLWITLAAWLVIAGILAGASYAWIVTRGVKRFENL